MAFTMKSVLLLLVPLLCLCGVRAVNDTTLVAVTDLDPVNDTTLVTATDLNEVNVTMLMTAKDVHAVNHTVWVYDKDPDPQKNFTACGRDKPSWICDPDHHLTNEQGDELDDLIDSFSGVQRCLCDEVNFCPDTFHHIIMVAIVSRTDASSTPCHYALRLRYFTWKEHKSSCSIFGVLVLDVERKHGCLVMEKHTFLDLPHYNMTAARQDLKSGQIFETAKDVLEEIKRALADHRYVTTGGIIGIIFGILIGGAFLVVCVVKVYKAVTNNEQELLANDFVAFEHEFILAENSNSPTQA